jgi:YegS/Rv2252/BmrU family lipid kinase
MTLPGAEISATTRTVVVLNPAASNGGAARRWPVIERGLGRHFVDLEVRPTTGPGHGTELCRTALEQGAELVIAVGGDGTNNEVLCGFVDADGHNRFPDAILGIVAAGTGGDFQRTFGTLPPAAQVERLCAARPITIDYGVAEFLDHDDRPAMRPFLNTASVGISGLVVRHVATASRGLGSRMAYVGSSLRGIWEWRNKQAWVQRDDEPEARVDLTLALVANGQYFGAGMWGCPDASLGDGELDVLTLVSMSRPVLISTLAKVFKGKHLRVRGVEYAKARRFSVRPVAADCELLLELDGEQPGRAPATFRVVPGGLRALVA